MVEEPFEERPGPEFQRGVGLAGTATVEVVEAGALVVVEVVSNGGSFRPPPPLRLVDSLGDPLGAVVVVVVVVVVGAAPPEPGLPPPPPPGARKLGYRGSSPPDAVPLPRVWLAGGPARVLCTEAVPLAARLGEPVTTGGPVLAVAALGVEELLLLLAPPTPPPAALVAAGAAVVVVVVSAPLGKVLGLERKKGSCPMPLASTRSVGT